MVPAKLQVNNVHHTPLTLRNNFGIISVCTPVYDTLIIHQNMSGGRHGG